MVFWFESLLGSGLQTAHKRKKDDVDDDGDLDIDGDDSKEYGKPQYPGGDLFVEKLVMGT